MGHVVRAGAAAGLLDPATGHGPIARRDARLRVVAEAAFAVTVVALARLDVLALALACAIAAMLLARLPVAQTLRRVAAMDTFIVVMIAMLPFTVPGTPAFELFDLVASWEGLAKAAAIALKANAVVLMAMALLSTLEPVTLARALRGLGMPERLVHLVLFTVRYVDVLDQEYRRLRTAMRARGFRPANSRHTYVSFGYLVGMMLVRALERSERILKAMKCRGFSGRLTLDARWEPGRGDVAFGAVFTGLILGLIVLEAQGGIAA
ncbi:cobalt ECF transporter T component CbiQ [Blastochloris sulfoviridis]|uniref:Cobalt ECF transporter T component CbiQ n=1 Tax=Blastochloris sulfoviridis TaxID=50712 RepID=A0A5M6I1T5_9HYPH|nr:cobalt ECF transporter T component CbiQ [Blastochloris sulfoviridis]KAA5602164.1 cobalt ECF transporter T component CbiQ [Blastochloris sulfoviridis]